MDYLTHATFVAAGAVTLAVQILKLKIVPLQLANKYPVPTNIALSTIAAIVIVNPKWSWDNVTDGLIQIGTVAVIAAITYNQLLGRWSELKNLEG